MISLIISYHHLIWESSPVRFKLTTVHSLIFILNLTVVIKIVKVSWFQSLWWQRGIHLLLHVLRVLMILRIPTLVRLMESILQFEWQRMDRIVWNLELSLIAFSYFVIRACHLRSNLIPMYCQGFSIIRRLSKVFDLF